MPSLNRSSVVRRCATLARCRARASRTSASARAAGALRIARILAVVDGDAAAIEGGLFFGELDRRRAHLVPGELLDGGDQPRFVGGEVLRGGRRAARRHDSDHVRRSDISLDEFGGALADRKRVARRDVQRVEDEHEHPAIADRLVRRDVSSLEGC